VQSNVAKEIIKIGNNDVVMGDCFKWPVIIYSLRSGLDRQ
jgi:hypothetical protein